VQVLHRSVCRAALPDGDALPTEFCLFVPGENPNYNADAKGQPTPVFTADSAKRVQADSQRKGTDYFLDLEHASLEKNRADATDSMCWFNVEVRPDGSAWAVNLRWTPEGERRLRGKLQRYTSPVFTFDTETGEIVEFVGCALTSDPATYGIAPLVAASVARVNDRATPAALALLRMVAERRLTRHTKK
jgi:phage I-like protein